MTPHEVATMRAQKRIEAAQRARQYIASRPDALDELNPNTNAVHQLGWFKASEANAAIDNYLREAWQG